MTAASNQRRLDTARSSFADSWQSAARQAETSQALFAGPLPGRSTNGGGTPHRRTDFLGVEGKTCSGGSPAQAEIVQAADQALDVAEGNGAVTVAPDQQAAVAAELGADHRPP